MELGIFCLTKGWESRKIACGRSPFAGGRFMKEKLKKTEKSADKVIQERVLRRLGRPPHLHSIDVKHLWGKKYRVNIWIKTNTD